MILGLASAVEQRPFCLGIAAAYLRDWVTEKMVLEPPLDISILTFRPPSRGAMLPSGTSDHVTAFEPSVSNVRVERTSAQGPQEAITTPRMAVICGIAKTLHDEGCDWVPAFQKAYELWGKLNPNVASALDMDTSEGNVQNGDVAESIDAPHPPVEDLEDDTGVPLEAEFDR